LTYKHLPKEKLLNSVLVLMWTIPQWICACASTVTTAFLTQRFTKACSCYSNTYIKGILQGLCYVPQYIYYTVKYTKIKLMILLGSYDYHHLMTAININKVNLCQLKAVSVWISFAFTLNIQLVSLWGWLHTSRFEPWPNCLVQNQLDTG